MATSLIFGGIFNIVDPILNIQLYIWAWVLILVVCVFTWIAWYYGQWKPLTPMHGIYFGRKHGSNAAFIFDLPLHGEMVAEWVAKCIFDYSKWDYALPGSTIPILGKYLTWIQKITFYYPTAFLDDIDYLHGVLYKYQGVNKNVELARKLQGGEWERTPSVSCGGVDVDIVIDADNWTIRDSPQHKAIENAGMIWNEGNPTDQIHSYTKFQRYLIAGKIVCPGIQKDISIDWTRVDKGFTTDLQASEYVGKKIQMAEETYNADELSKNRIALYVLIAGVGLAALVIIIRFVSFLMNHKG